MEDWGRGRDKSGPVTLLSLGTGERTYELSSETFDENYNQKDWFTSV
jgi:hypothetical protein